MRNETLPAQSLLTSRMQAMTLAAVAQLNPTANWHQIMSERISESPPRSPLGAAEAEFFADRPSAARDLHRGGDLGARTDVELAVGAGEVHLDGLDRHE
jgi:hypothetical protein